MTNSNRPRPATTILMSAPIGGAAAKGLTLDGPSLADIMPYAPRVDRADLKFDNNDWCPQQRINYPDAAQVTDKPAS